MDDSHWLWCPTCGYRDTAPQLSELLRESHKTPCCPGPMYQVPSVREQTGALVTIEGLDGCGKTTLWESLKDRFGDQEDIVFTREPTSDTWYGDAVYRSLEDDDADSLAELYLYMADHANHLSEVIQPALDDGKLVICDRYLDSRCAYQAATLQSEYGRGILNHIYKMHEQVSRFPDLTLYLDVAPKVAAERSEQANKFERAEYLAGVKAFYDDLRNRDSDRFVSVDTEEHSPDEVADKVTGLLGLATSQIQFGSSGEVGSGTSRAQ